MAKEQSKGPEYLEDIMNEESSGMDTVPANNSRANDIIKKFNLSDRFTILTDKKIPDWAGLFSKAFEVRDLKQKEDIYAIILSSNLPIRFQAIQKAKQFFHPSFTNVIDAGFTDVAKGEFGSYAVVMENPQGRKLSAYASEQKAIVGEIKLPQKPLMSEEFISQYIVSPINEVLKLFTEHEICHGKINHDTVFIGKSEELKVMLTDCFSEPCGYSQYHQYEPVDRAQCMPLGKGNGSVRDDYFALGVLVIYCVLGEIPGKNADISDFITQRLTKGTYNAYLGTMELPPSITDLLRGLLTDNSSDRWGYEQVYSWCKGKKFNLIRPKMRKEAIRAYEFAGVIHTSKKHLAQTYYLNWDDAAKDIRDKKLLKWLELSVLDKETADNVMSLVAATGGEKSKSRGDDDELISKALIALDPDAPVRFRNVCVNIDGVGAMLANAWIHQHQNEIQIFNDIIRLNLLDYKAVHAIETQKVDRWVLQRLQNYIKIKSIGFGLERCLYDLNPTLPCQSSLLTHQFVIDINQLLYFLNDNSSRLVQSEPVDRHIAAFLASKLELAQEIKLKIMKQMKDDRAKGQLVKLALLAFAQRKSNSGKLSGLANWTAGKLKSVVDSLHSRKLRKDMTSEMKSLADQGNLEAIMQLVCSSEYFQRDADGFAEAQRYFAIQDQELRQIRARQGMAMKHDSHYQFGLYLAKILGVLCFLTTLVITSI
jgi:hypothetical protein